MTDAERSKLERQKSVDPQDEEAAQRLLAERARSEGEDVYLECLRDRLLWNRSSESVQDLAVAVIENRLGAAFIFKATKLYRCAGLTHRIATFEHKGSGARLGLIPGSEGSAAVIAPLLLGRFAVSQKIWDRIGGDDERSFSGRRRPIESVSWDAVQGWLAKAGDGLRLPFEAEWEHGCRAGSTTPFCFGASVTIKEVNVGRPYDPERGRPSDAVRNETVYVGSLPANAFGLYEVHGNVWEWCQDAWREGRRYPTELPWQVARGGSWYGGAEHARSESRVGNQSDAQENTIGFRLARSLP